ncbi:hypothetical protein [Verrucomicrobium spinosum]|uniref:hypothetical protein n=1 Tax=Verrucomicrobium spinosum TaxID=2736 RepID=UPI00210EC19D|nr:hypothetical protein [Verrucomicrobium spinosum]
MAFLTGIAETIREVRAVVEGHCTAAQWEGVFTAAEGQERNLWAALQLTADQAADLQSLAAAMHYGSRELKPVAEPLPLETDVNAVFGQHRIPRDRMQIVVCGGWGRPVTQEALRARRYWSAKGFFTNFIVLAEDAKPAPPALDDRVFTLNSRELDSAQRAVLLAAASLVVEHRLPEVAVQTAPPRPPWCQSWSRRKLRPPCWVSRSSSSMGMAASARTARSMSSACRSGVADCSARRSPGSMWWRMKRRGF